MFFQWKGISHVNTISYIYVNIEQHINGQLNFLNGNKLQKNSNI